jgi:hypothetical protein
MYNNNIIIKKLKIKKKILKKEHLTIFLGIPCCHPPSYA